jgi:hypothetical protein
MDIGRAISYVTEDERWMTKLGIAVVVILCGSFLLIPLPLLVGYQLGIMQNVMAGSKRPLPEWDDLGKLFMDGLNVIIALLVYTAPAWLLLCIGMSTTILPVLGGENEDMVGALATLTIASWSVVACLAMLFSLVLFFFVPAVMIQYARTGQLGACFRFGEVFAIVRENIVNIILVAVINFVASLIVQAIAGVLISTFCLAIVGIPLAWLGSVWILAVTGHLYGQIGAMGGYKTVNV